MEIANAKTDEKNGLKTAKLERKLGRNLFEKNMFLTVHQNVK
jgi:hypothetical protein